MANKTKVGKRRSNPMRRSAAVGRPKIAFNGQTIYSTLFSDQSAVAANVGTDWLGVDTNSGEGINRAGVDIVKHYQEYKYLSALCEWIPKVGPSHADSGSRISIAYIDNPELLIAYETASAAVRVTMVRNAANVKTFNAWERFTFRVPITFRRKWFNVNPTVAAVGSRSSEEYDRAVQGKVIMCYETVSAIISSGVLGQWRATSNTQLQGFTATSLT